MKNYRSIHKSIPFSFVINKSEFIGNCKFVESEEQALEFVDSIKTKYHDATHNCSAYIIGEDKLKSSKVFCQGNILISWRHI